MAKRNHTNDTIFPNNINGSKVDEYSDDPAFLYFKVASMLPNGVPLPLPTDFIQSIGDNIDMETVFKQIETLQSNLAKCIHFTHTFVKNSDEKFRVLRAELMAAQEKNNGLEDTVKKMRDTAEILVAESMESKKALKLAKAELEVCVKPVLIDYSGSSSSSSPPPSPSSSAVVVPTENPNHVQTLSHGELVNEASSGGGDIVDPLDMAKGCTKNPFTSELHSMAEQLQKKYAHIASLKGQVEFLKGTVQEKDIQYGESIMTLRRILEDKDRLYHATSMENMRRHELFQRCLQDNYLLKREVECQRIILGNCKKQNIGEEERLKDEYEMVKQKLYEKEDEIITLKKCLKEKADELQDIEDLKNTLLVKERSSTDELQQVRDELLSGLNDSTWRSNIRIKKMGEIDQKPFQVACKEKFSSEDWDMKSAGLCSLWQENIKDPHWHPFNKIWINDKLCEEVDAADPKLKELRDAWGEHVYEAVCVALSEINEYNPSGRYAVREFWNSKEDRKSSLKEAVEYLVKQLKFFKSRSKHPR
ncbi:factor of DNA methylation 1-like [Thalictrum thalictroides]|uniref:Factor of DNA methylation 1-like n=1 Tax=Thalictrum thalictroides TaxID=46969 RepID=A0A7J6V3G4_THATH|nr:factor of DNA methylation 1-like [Thalictrum thalictroides]